MPKQRIRIPLCSSCQLNLQSDFAHLGYFYAVRMAYLWKYNVPFDSKSNEEAWIA